MRTVFSLCAFVSSLCTLLYGQTVALTLGGGSTAPGASVSLPLSISNGGVSTAAVQWTLSYSPTDFSSGTVNVGPVTTSLNKNLTCNSPAAGRYDCVLWALDENALSDGVLAYLNLTTANTVSASPAIMLINSLASSPAAQAVSVTATGATLSTGLTVTGLSCSPRNLVAPGSTSCSVTLSGAAPPGDAVVSLGYTQDTSATVSAPTSVTVPSGATSAVFSVDITGASRDSTLQIDASLNGSTVSSSVRIRSH